MKLDHIAIRTTDRQAVVDQYVTLFGYSVVETFPVDFGDGDPATCTHLRPNALEHNPEIFISEGGKVVDDWVYRFGNGIHHIAFAVDSVEDTMKEWKSQGISFSSEAPMVCPEDGLIQIFTKRDVSSGLVYELIQRQEGASNFCRESVKNLMLASQKEFK